MRNNKLLLKAFSDPTVTSMEDLADGEDLNELEEGEELPAESTDGDTEGTVLEREFEVYGTIEDLDGLKERAASTEYQEQCGIPINSPSKSGPCGSIRVRKTQEGDGDEKYTMAVKVKGDNGSEENEFEIPSGAFELFSRLVPDILKKTRYKFPVKGTEFELEVDVFKDADGNDINKVKVDLEVDADTDVNSITMPFKLDEPRLIKPGKKSEEDLAFVRELFDNHYTIKNPLHAVAEELEENSSESESEEDTDLPGEGGTENEADAELDNIDGDDANAEDVEENPNSASIN